MADDLTAAERALRKLPLPYSLALRLRDAGVAPEVICLYVDVDGPSLASLYRIAEAKLAAAREPARDRGDDDSGACAQGAAQHSENSVLHH